MERVLVFIAAEACEKRENFESERSPVFDEWKDVMNNRANIK